MLIMDGGRGARQVVNLIDLDVEGESNIVPYKFEASVADQMFYVSACAGEKIVNANNICTRSEQPLTKV
jgi:hypothetical protein